MIYHAGRVYCTGILEKFRLLILFASNQNAYIVKPMVSKCKVTDTLVYVPMHSGVKHLIDLYPFSSHHFINVERLIGKHAYLVYGHFGIWV